jgi:hypothetical protein
MPHHGPSRLEAISQKLRRMNRDNTRKDPQLLLNLEAAIARTARTVSASFFWLHLFAAMPKRYFDDSESSYVSPSQAGH